MKYNLLLAASVATIALATPATAQTTNRDDQTVDQSRADAGTVGANNGATATDNSMNGGSVSAGRVAANNASTATDNSDNRVDQSQTLTTTSDSGPGQGGLGADNGATATDNSDSSSASGALAANNGATATDDSDKS